MASLGKRLEFQRVHRKGSEASRVRTTIATVPDAPVSKIVIELKGGKKHGLLVNSTNICARAQKVDASFTGQNGARVSQSPPLVASCGKASAKRRAARAKRRAGR